jgi:hypothetical protein
MFRYNMHITLLKSNEHPQISYFHFLFSSLSFNGLCKVSPHIRISIWLKSLPLSRNVPSPLYFLSKPTLYNTKQN